MSGAAIVKKYIEKYVFFNLWKTKRNKYEDQQFARICLSIAYNVIHEMEFLILSNNANDFPHIKQYLTEQINLIHQELKKKQPFLASMFTKTELPDDLKKCLTEAWFHLQYCERTFVKKVWGKPKI